MRCADTLCPLERHSGRDEVGSQPPPGRPSSLCSCCEGLRPPTSRRGGVRRVRVLGLAFYPTARRGRGARRIGEQHGSRLGTSTSRTSGRHSRASRSLAPSRRLATSSPFALHPFPGSSVASRRRDSAARLLGPPFARPMRACANCARRLLREGFGRRCRSGFAVSSIRRVPCWACPSGAPSFSQEGVELRSEGSWSRPESAIVAWATCRRPASVAKAVEVACAGAGDER